MGNVVRPKSRLTFAAAPEKETEPQGPDKRSSNTGARSAYKQQASFSPGTPLF